jgi:hypothetical protein
MGRMGSTFVVSDVHGHLEDLRDVLTQADLLDADDGWTGGDAELWVLGDMVDRGPDGIGVIRFLRSLSERAPGRVHVLLGNHESLMLGEKLFPETRFTEVWQLNGGHRSDQEALTDEETAWLRALPAMARVGDFLLMHSDTTGYLTWGSSVEEVNATLGAILAGDDAQAHFDVFAALTDRYDFSGEAGPEVARRMLSTYGGDCIVHGHSIIGSLTDVPSSQVDEPLVYADGLVVDIDGGRYDGGPLLLLELD